MCHCPDKSARVLHSIDLVLFVLKQDIPRWQIALGTHAVLLENDWLVQALSHLCAVCKEVGPQPGVAVGAIGWRHAPGIGVGMHGGKVDTRAPEVAGEIDALVTVIDPGVRLRGVAIGAKPFLAGSNHVVGVQRPVGKEKEFLRVCVSIGGHVQVELLHIAANSLYVGGHIPHPVTHHLAGNKALVLLVIVRSARLVEQFPSQNGGVVDVALSRECVVAGDQVLDPVLVGGAEGGVGVEELGIVARTDALVHPLLDAYEMA